MTAVQIKITSSDFLDPDFSWYEFAGDQTNLALGLVEAGAAFRAIAFTTNFLRAGLTPGDTWYHWVRTVRNNGTVKSEWLALGAVVVMSVGTAELGDGAVTYAKIQAVSADKLLGRAGTSGTVQEITLTAAGRAILDDADASAQRATLGIDAAADARITLQKAAAGGLASLDVSGYLPATQHPALTGDVTTPAGSVSTTIGSNVVTFAKFQQISTARLLGRSTSGTGNVEQISLGSGLSLSGGVLDTAGGGGGSGTVTSVALSAPGFLSVSGSPVTSSGTLALSLATQTANLVFAGPSSGSAATPTFRSLVGADLPNPSSSTLGGVQSKASVSNQFLTQISTSGVVSSAQPSHANLSDYVEGTWTPSEGYGAFTWTNCRGRYRKLGTAVMFWCYFSTAASQPSAAQVYMAGLPYAAVASDVFNFPGGTSQGFYNWNLPSGGSGLYCYSNTFSAQQLLAFTSVNCYITGSYTTT